MALAAGQTGHLADHQEGVYTVVHGATAGTTRPTLGSASTAPTVVKWIGSVEPTNAVNNDEWWDTDNDLVKIKQSGSFVASGSGTYVATADDVFIGVGDLVKGPNGSAAIGRIENITTWLLDPSTTEDVVGATMEPSLRGWATMDVSAIIAPADATASAGVDDGVSLNLQYGQAAVGSTMDRDAQPSVTGTVPAVAGQLTKVSLVSALAVVADGVFNFDLLRSGGAAGDTYSADIGVYGVLLEKVS